MHGGPIHLGGGLGMIAGVTAEQSATGPALLSDEVAREVEAEPEIIVAGVLGKPQEHAAALGADQLAAVPARRREESDVDRVLEEQRHALGGDLDVAEQEHAGARPVWEPLDDRALDRDRDQAVTHLHASAGLGDVEGLAFHVRPTHGVVW